MHSGRINTDDEPVPGFVHQIASGTLFPPTVVYTSDAKGSPAGDADVTLRLETPVLYFHVPKGRKFSTPIDVDVAFHGGWLSQYFPDARAVVDGVSSPAAMPVLTGQTIGRLSWKSLGLDTDQGEFPATSDRVWTAPRAVDASLISSGNEREHFLFYRGVGHVDAPVRVTRTGQTLEARATSPGITIGQAWLVDIHSDGQVAFRGVPHFTNGPAAFSEFAPDDYLPENLGHLRTALRDVLTADGLFADEADALLNTWERSYFQNPGERLFFMVPQTWTDAVLPLKISVPAEITRVMVGRIELVTPTQRTILRRMGQLPLPDQKALKKVTTAMTRLRNDPNKTAAYNALAGGHGNLSDLGLDVPAIYADFLSLGRFRTSLVLNFKDDSRTMTALANELVP